MTAQPRILVVDDEPRAIELLVRSLRKLGRVSTASTALEALPLANATRFDLVLTDQRMPGMTGVELLSRIAEHDEHVGRILITGYTDLEACVDAINRGRVHAYLHKPCSPPDLMATATGVLQRVAISRENQRLLALVTRQNEQLEQALAALRESQDRVVASARLAAIGRMIAMVVHDLRSPLAAIRSSGTEVLNEAQRLEIPELRELGQDVVQESERLQRMCSELLEISHASEGRAQCLPESLDDAVRAALAPLGRDAAHLGVTLELALACEHDVALDEHGLRRVLHNLARNAFEAMPEGGTLRIETGRADNHAVLVLSDTGPGIPTQIAERIFEPFVTHGKPAGCGLGLAVVRKIVDDLGGTIALGKAEGGGARFEIRLPLAAPTG